MNLEMPVVLAAGYSSRSQRVRVITEGWAERNLYCAHCRAPRLDRSRNNARLVDFVCPSCSATYQLKSLSRPFARRIVDSAYLPMRRAAEEGRVPHLLALRYSPASWKAVDLILVPGFAITASCIEMRNPLSPKARRRGWVGCSILLSNVPLDARIPVISGGIPADPGLVRSLFGRVEPLEGLDHQSRGWALDVLHVARSVGKPEFDLQEIYAHSSELRSLHPGNRHVHEKIRQQLQRLRDMGLVEFLGAGHYALRR